MPFFVSKKKINDLTQETENLRNIFTQAGGEQAAELGNLVSRLMQQKLALDGEIQAAQTHQSQLYSECAQLSAQLAELQGAYTNAAALAEYGLTDFQHPAELSIDLQEHLKQTQARIKEMVREKTAYRASTTFTFNNSHAKGKKFVADMAKMMLRAYNAEAENCVLTVKAGNGESARKRLERARDQVKKLGSMIDLEITFDYHKLRLEELDLALRYQNAKKLEKENEREERARLREEAKARKEIEAERAKLAKERSHYENVLAELRSHEETSGIAEMEAKLAEIQEQIDSMDFRAANQRAGYVYVISNIGAFGERMVKIGMTRRLDPLDRVRELSDASVPFNFDVHALFFSEDAVQVETELHHCFADKRVNLVNPRREFFAVTPREVKEALKNITGNLLEFREDPEAEQYHQSEALRILSNR